jgi:hypothetical protein
MLYLAFSFYLLPALSSILKVRKRKLSSITSANSNEVALADSAVLTNSSNISTNVQNKLASINNSNLLLNKLTSKLSLISLKSESISSFNIQLIGKTQLLSLLV